MTHENIGLMGGTFDPIHIGHLVIAQRAMEQLDLNAVIFLPAGLPPHKQDEEHTSAIHRVAMTRLAIESVPNFRISERDVREDRASYTVDLLRDVKADNPDANLTFIIGADSLRDFARWREPEAIVRIARLAVAARPEVSVPEDIYQQVRGLREAIDWIESPLLDIAATELRDRISRGATVQHLVPASVLAYIQQRKLYRS
ncbi:MAG: nicotinate-nucleotide adenylyltransferase [Thermomicrobiales bacterium]